MIKHKKFLEVKEKMLVAESKVISKNVSIGNNRNLGHQDLTITLRDDYLRSNYYEWRQFVNGDKIQNLRIKVVC